MDETLFTVFEVDLQKDLQMLLAQFKGIQKIYLFGSRAYKTNSTRSDIDIYLITKNIIAPSELDRFIDEHEYLDIFTGTNKCISSCSTNALIVKKGFKSLSKQLDAVLLWSSKQGFINSDYYIHEVFKKQRHLKTGRDGRSQNFLTLKSKLNHRLLKKECQYYIQESLVDYENMAYTSSVSMIGLACETLINSLVNGCSKKYSNDNPGFDWANTYTPQPRPSAKNKLDGLMQYFKDERVFFENNNFAKLNELIVAFDVIRNYRNDADHPNQYVFQPGQIDLLYGGLSLYLEKILLLIKFLPK